MAWLVVGVVSAPLDVVRPHPWIVFRLLVLCLLCSVMRKVEPRAGRAVAESSGVSFSGIAHFFASAIQASTDPLTAAGGGNLGACVVRL